MIKSIGVVGCLMSDIFGQIAGSLDTEDDDSSDIYYIMKSAFAFVGKFGVSGTFGVIFVHASELYPTPIRSIAVGLASAAGRIGGVLAPLVNALGHYVSWLPMLIFAILGSIQVMSTFWMPETLGIRGF